ncbi:MAG TPA: antibiotic biosynthesis monooxygenase family protein [Pseudonocardia sp.]|jgi:quinol monooxygenase YgiN|nr:antibiotic biosynthesis monooxygenase family protein [Pseudonocardia sp.]
MLLICRFDISPDGEQEFLSRARRALALLTAASGCRHAELARAIEQPTRWVLTARFDSVVAYRRALSPFDVREHVIPLLSEALADEPATYETLVDASSGAITEHTSLLASPDERGRI